MSGTTRWGTLIVITTALAALVGCQSSAGPSQTVSAARPAPAPTADGPVALPRSVELFGDRPEYEAVPYENRLLMNFARHTFTSDGRDFDPDLGPDGSRLVFASTRNSAAPDIYAKQVDGTTLTQLTDDPADDVQPRFSPDGNRIAFCSNRAGNWDVWVINRDGTGLTQLTLGRDDEIAPCWAPDGQHIAYCVWGPRSHQWEIWTLSVGEPGVKRFLCYGMFPSWSPDGTKIAFQRARQRGSRWFGIWTVKLVGDEARYPTEVAYSDVAACIAPRWSADGNLLVYCAVKPSPVGSGQPVAASDLWLVHPETGQKYKLTDAGAVAFNPVWSPEGNVYFVSTEAGVENIWSLTTDYRTVLSALGVPAGPTAQTNSPPETVGK